MLTTVSNTKPSILNLSTDSNRSFLSFPGLSKKQHDCVLVPLEDALIGKWTNGLNLWKTYVWWSCAYGLIMYCYNSWLYYQSHMFERKTICYYKYVSTSTCLTNAHTHTFVYFSNQSGLIVVIPNYSYYGFKIMWIQITESDNHLLIDQILHFCCVAIPHF